MNKPKYSNDLSKSKLCTTEEMKERYKLSRNTLMKIAMENVAVRKIGRAVRFDIEAMDEAIDNYI